MKNLGLRFSGGDLENAAEGKGEDKTAAVTFARFNTDGSAMKFHDALADPQAEARAELAIFDFGLLKFPEDRIQLFGWNSAAGVFNNNIDTLVLVFDLQGHLPLIGREFEGIPNEVIEYPF